MVNINIKRDFFAYIDCDDSKLYDLIKRSFVRKERVYNNFYKMYEEVVRSYYTLLNNENYTIKIKAGLVPYLCRSFDLQKIKYNLVDERKKFNEKELKYYKKLSDRVTLRDYQEKAVTTVLNDYKEKAFCFIQAATGSGKTEISASLLKSFQNAYPEEAALYLVPTLVLKRDAEQRFTEYGLKVNTEFPIKTGKVNILTYKAILSANTEKYDYKQRDNIGALIVDEGHHLSAPKLSKQVHRLHNLRLNVGISATPSSSLETEEKTYLKQLDCKELVTFGCTGDLIYKIGIKDSVKENCVTNIEVRILKNKLDYDKKDITDWQDVKNKILKSDERALTIAKYVKHIVDDANLHTVTLLIPEVQWAEDYMCTINTIFQNDDINIYELYGKERIFKYCHNKRVLLNEEEKKEEMEKIKSSKYKTIFSCTSFFYEGANIPSIQAIVNCYGGKDSKRIKQQCGRAMRLFEGKKVAYIHEIQDIGNPVLESQFNKRIRIYNNEYDAKIIYSSFKE